MSDVTRPNLFQHVTSELSQDAFIAWLLEWGNPNYSEKDEALYHCSHALIRSFFEKCGKRVPTNIETITIKQQFKHIDILCIVNDNYAVIIEDKTNTEDHSGQLKRYSTIVEEEEGFASEAIVPIYFKTGDQCNYDSVKEAKYELFLRNDFLKVLRTCSSANDIFTDYREHLEEIEEQVESFKDSPPEEWSALSPKWVGFYKRLQSRLDVCGWKYVANPSGGFYALWWNSIKVANCCLYLQLEESKLCFKIAIVKEEQEDKKEEKRDRAFRREIRNSWHKKLMERANDYNLSLQKPDRFGSGTWMTVCVSGEEYIKCTSGLVDIDKTVSYLRQSEDLVNSFKQD